jgi:hypothetical protein
MRQTEKPIWLESRAARPGPRPQNRQWRQLMVPKNQQKRDGELIGAGFVVDRRTC